MHCLGWLGMAFVHDSGIRQRRIQIIYEVPTSILRLKLGCHLQKCLRNLLRKLSFLQMQKIKEFSNGDADAQLRGKLRRHLCKWNPPLRIVNHKGGGAVQERNMA